LTNTLTCQQGRQQHSQQHLRQHSLAGHGILDASIAAAVSPYHARQISFDQGLLRLLCASQRMLLRP
jgi:hypothetical protein